ncbi:MAG: hypothetical protein JW736_08835 [Deltaproteobacteria bacterium]|nr:hypothetical protein [Deltaproteobacteria bacterium]MBN2688134.1 hypothetical protein [Deltaproteobacteria bacterium]
MRQQAKIWKSVVIVMIFLGMALVSCTRYERKVVPFKLPSAYPNAVEVAGSDIAAKAYGDPKEAGEAFGFNIIGAGILPVQVIFDNKGTHEIEIVPASTFLVDTDSNLWPILDAGLAYDRIAKKTELGEVAPEGAKSGLLAGTAGAIIGAAIGIVTGANVGDAAMKGAAVGAAAGVTLGGTKGLSERDVQREIREDLQTRSLERRGVRPGEIAHGFIFFPGEAKQARELRLTIRETDTGVVHPLIMKLGEDKKG